MRCFIAVDIDYKIRHKIMELQKKIRELGVHVKLVEPQNLHFTIKFLGNVNDCEVESIASSLEKCTRKRTPFKIKISGVGYFGNPSRIRTLWLGVDEGKCEFVNFMKDVNESVKLGKFSSSPHLTIGRVKSGLNNDAILKFVREENNVNVGEMYINEVKLKSSMLDKGGPVYSDLKIFKLPG